MFSFCDTPAGAGKSNITACETLGNDPAANEGVNGGEMMKCFSIDSDHVARKQEPSTGIL